MDRNSLDSPHFLRIPWVLRGEGLQPFRSRRHRYRQNTLYSPTARLLANTLNV